MGKPRFYFHLFIILVALVKGGVSIWYSGLWLNEAKSVPNFTAIAMVLLVFSQGILLKTGFRKNNK